MKLTVRDVAALLQVSEKSVYRWIKQDGFPAYRVNDQYRFNRAEILEWATAHRMPVSPELLHEPESRGATLPSLSEALETGGIHYRVGGADKESALRAVVDVLHLPEEVDRDYLLRVLLAREALGSTGVGNGIAIPHVRNPIVLHVPRASIALCFLDKPIEFDAIDGRPVHTLFILVSPTVRAHLHMLSRLAYALRSPKFQQALSGPGSREAVMEAARALEATMAPSRNPN
jgi:nitrogen PTS system EIIA component